MNRADTATAFDASRRQGLAEWQRSVTMALMTEHLAIGIRQETLAAACRLSSSAFLRAFVRATGSTPHRWLTAHRIDRALELMQDPSAMLCDIALRVGFADQSHFSRVFARQMGASPGAWRREQGRPAVVGIRRPPTCLINRA